MRRSLLVFGFLATLSLAARAIVAADPPKVVGSYTVTGDVESGNPYSGTLDITAEADCFNLKWKTGKDLSMSFTGLAIREGDVLAATVSDDKDPKYRAVIAYQIAADGKLVGHWAMPGSKGKVLTETATPAPSK